jgi:NAD(P)-dependent dehydrogenase (short-subunit alcohol dehydrogenase family)
LNVSSSPLDAGFCSGFDLKAAAEATEAQIIESFPMRRWGSMEDAAGSTIFFASKAGSCLTGVVIPCDGGATSIG